MFSQNFKKEIVKLFKKADPPMDAPPPPTDAPPPTEGGYDLDAVLQELQTEIEAGTVGIDEASITEWCKNKGVSEEDIQFIVSMVSDAGSGDMPQQEGEPMQDDGIPTEDEFEKSLLKQFGKSSQIQKTFTKGISNLHNRLHNLEVVHVKLIDKYKGLEKENVFLKSELSRISNEPSNVKNPAKDISDLNKTFGRKEIVEMIKSGIKEGKLSHDDMLSYEVNGKLPENILQFRK